MDVPLKSDLIKQIKRYQACISSIDPPENDVHGVLRYIRKLSKLPIKLEELEETGVGKTINALRKRNGSIGEEAALLVAKWKSIVKKQVEDKEEEEEEEKETESLKKKKSKKEIRSVHHVKSNSSNDDGQTEAKHELQKVENSVRTEQKLETKSATHLITLKNRNKRKHSNQSEDVDGKKYIKISEKGDREPCPGQMQSQRNTVDVSPNQTYKESSHSEVTDSDSEKCKKKNEHDEKKHKKGHEKRHKTSKHSRKSDRHHRHHSKSSHHEKKLRNEETGQSSDKYHHKDGESSNKYHGKESKSKNKDDSKKHDKKHDSGKKTTSLAESKTNGKKSKGTDPASSENNLETNDDFGAALLNIPHSISVNKKRSSSSKSSTYQDSLRSPSPHRSATNFDLFSNSVSLEPLDLADDLKDSDDFYSSPNNNSQVRSTGLLSKTEEDDMLNSMIVTKNQRTKVFSGNKGSKHNNTKFPTLFELCARILQENFDALEYTGGVPYDVLKPILEKVTVQQLYTFENYNPYLIGDTDELWKYHAKKEFRKAERMEYESWRDLYVRCVEEREEKLQSLTENITQSMQNSTPIRKTKLAYIDTIVKPPRNVARSQAKHGTGFINSKTSPNQSSPTAAQSVKDRLAKEAMSPNAIQVPSKANLLVKKKKAPLMQKSLKIFKGLNKR